MWPILGNYSLRGIDSNNNGVRDDIEVRLHRRVTDSDYNYKNILEYSRILEAGIYSPIKNKKDYYTYLREAHCIDMDYLLLSRYALTSGDIEPKQTLDEIIFNTKQREQKNEKYVILPGRVSFDSETECKSDFDLSVYENESPNAN